MLERLAMTGWARTHPGLAFRDELDALHLAVTPRTLPRLLADRARVRVHARLHPAAQAETPWVTRDALRLLEQLITPTDVGLEFGSGGSTVWFARHSARVLSVEAVATWHATLLERLDRRGIGNVTAALVAPGRHGYPSPEHRAAYVAAHPSVATGSLDWVFVDGEYRDACFLRGIELVRPGGVLVLDNANAYLPGPGRGPWRVTRPVTAEWELAAQKVADWRRLWTTNGVWDTAIWLRP